MLDVAFGCVAVPQKFAFGRSGQLWIGNFREGVYLEQDACLKFQMELGREMQAWFNARRPGVHIACGDKD